MIEAVLFLGVFAIVIFFSRGIIAAVFQNCSWDGF